LFPHATGRWAKKIKGKMRYFGRWNDPDGALREYQAFVAGKPLAKPRRTPTGIQTKPDKPYPDFPLFAHAAGVWAKKIKGKMYYFGPWDDPDGALKKYLEEKEALHSGRKPREAADGLTVRELANRFLNAKAAARDAGELTPRSWHDYKTACDLIVLHLGKTRLVTDLDPEDFAHLRSKMARNWSPVTLGNVIQRIRVIFNFALDDGLIDRPVLYGQGFKRPTKKTLRVHRAKQGIKLFTADEIRRLLDAAGTPMRAILLLGINCGFGNSDCGNLPLAALDLDNGWLDYPRPKTGINRRCPLWAETVTTLREAIAARPEAKDEEHAKLVFITKYGLPWAKDIADSPITKETRKLLDKLAIDGHRNFYTLRHTFRTIADEAKDQPAADYIMGHEVPHMSSVYRETISDERLKAVTDHVRRWLYGVGQEAPPEVETAAARA
jgi:integrase